MAEPARQLSDDDIPGNTDSTPPGRAELEVLEGGGESSEPNHSWYKSDKKHVDKDELSDREEPKNDNGQSEEVHHENQIGPGYKKSENTRKNVSWLIRHRRSVFGGGAVGSLIAVIIFFISSGPLQFIHLAHLLEQFHFSTQQTQQDDRFLKEARFLHYASSSEVEKTRLGYLGNKLADSFETKLNASGFKSAYSPKFGLFDGYIVDTSSKESPFYGMSDEEAKKAVKSATGLEVVDGGSVRSNLKGNLVVDVRGQGYFKTKALTTNMLSQAKYSKVSASVGGRLMCKRAGCTLHPLKLLGNKAKSALEDWWGKRNATDREGQSALAAQDRETTPDKKDPNAQETTDNNTKASQAINNTKNEAQGAKDDPGKFNGFKTSLSSRILGGGAAAVGLFCTVKGINQESQEIKRTQVVLPLIRMGTEMVAVGNQLESGQDISSSELSKYAALLNGKDANGKYSSWVQAKSILAEQGRTSSGTAGEPDDTLKSIGKGVPFDFVNQGLLGSILKPACAPAGLILTAAGSIVLDFTGVGALVGQLGAATVQSIVSGPILSQIAHWLAGSAVDVSAVGADFGNNINYGAKLAANDQALAAGGRALSTHEGNQLIAFENSQAEEKFKNQSVAYKLFSTHDEKSVISKVIDNTSPDPGQNLAKMSSVFLNFGHLFKTVPALFTTKAHATTASSYDYGFPTYGFSQEEMDNPALENPYENACYVVGCHDSTASTQHQVIIAAANTNNRVNINGIFENPSKQQTYIKKAKDCLGINIARDSNGKWNATDADGDPPNPYDSNYDASGCASSNDSDWLRVRFFIYDTESMNAVSCYSGEDGNHDTAQACSDVGFDESETQTTPTSNGPVAVSGNAKQLAQQILSNHNINLSCYSSSVPQDVQAAADGKPGTAGAMTSSAILQLIATVVKDHNVCVTAIQSNGQGHSAGSLHYSGDAVDFGNLDGTLLTGRDSGSVTIIKIAEGILPKGSGFGQLKDPVTGALCGPLISLPDGFTQFADTCNHLHVQVPKGTP
jgi:hypothetical protein